MEKTLERHLDESCRIPGVIGAICVDQHGLCLASKGEVSTFAAGPVASLAKQASTLNCQSATCPVIVVESQNGTSGGWYSGKHDDMPYIGIPYHFLVFCYICVAFQHYRKTIIKQDDGFTTAIFKT